MKTKFLSLIAAAALVLSASAAWACVSDDQCADGDSTTTDVCLKGYCRHHAYEEPTPLPEPTEPEEVETPVFCRQPPVGCFTDPSTVEIPGVRKACEGALDIIATNPSKDPEDTFCCLAREDDDYPADVWEKMKQDCGKLDKEKAPPAAEQCGILINVMGDFKNEGQMNVCCQTVINDGGSIESVVQTCSNGGDVSETPIGGEKIPATETPAPSGEETPAADEGDATVEKDPSDFMHIQGGASGCSLIR